MEQIEHKRRSKRGEGIGESAAVICACRSSGQNDESRARRPGITSCDYTYKKRTGGGEIGLVRTWLRGVGLLTTMHDDHVVQDSTAGAYLHQCLDAGEARRPVEYLPLLVEDTLDPLRIFAPPFFLSSKVLVCFTVPLGRVDQHGVLWVHAVA